MICCSKKLFLPAFLAAILCLSSCHIHGDKASMKGPFLQALTILDSTLLECQVDHPGHEEHGALWCGPCQCFHTRAAEALYPLAYLGSLRGDAELMAAAVRLGNWLVAQQEADGSWKETPEEWTGTTTDQLLMMALAWPLLKQHLKGEEREAWMQSMKGAGEYLLQVMDQGFASINYVATTAASLTALNDVIPDTAYTRRARELARCVVERMDPDGFIVGEGGRVDGIKYGVDPGYNMEMSLWGLGFYAMLSGDSLVWERSLASLYRHLPLIKPDGSLDNSWGIRSNKWTCYGGATSDGVQVLFSLFAKEDPVFRTAALRNLDYMKQCMTGGFMSYGPMHGDLPLNPPCIYPTFTKAKNLAMAHAFCTADEGPLPPLPSDLMGMEILSTLDVALVRTPKYHATVTAYGYKDPKGVRRKYMFRPTGGALSYLWLEGYGFLQAASQTEYHRWEPMSFPVMPELRPLTPRMELEREGAYYTNLYEFDALMEEDAGQIPAIRVSGHLKDREQQEGGVDYELHYVFGNRKLVKHLSLHFEDAPDTIRIVEPVILYPDARVEARDEASVLISRGELEIRFRLISGKARLIAGRDRDLYYACYPALRAFPLELVVVPEPGERERELIYEFDITGHP